MTRTVLRGLAARPMRTALTAFAVLLGVALVSAALTLTDTMRAASGSLSQSAYDGTAAVVSAKPAFEAESWQAQRPTLDDGTLAAVGRALDRRLRGEFGEGITPGDWASEVQDAVRTAWADGMQRVARQHARAGRHAAGAAVLETLVAREPLREGAHRELMVLLAAAGERARALRHYEHLADALRREVDAEPARETRELAQQLRRLA